MPTALVTGPNYLKVYFPCCDSWDSHNAIIALRLSHGSHQGKQTFRMIGYGGTPYPIYHFNPFLHSVSNMARSAKIFILIYEGIIKKNSYERRNYESVDEKSLSYTMPRKTMKEKRIRAVKC